MGKGKLLPTNIFSMIVVSTIYVQVKESNLSKVAGMQFATLRKTGLLHGYF